MTTINDVKDICNNFYRRSVQALPDSLLVGAIGGGLALIGMALKISCLVTNPLAAFVFCAVTHFLKKTVVSPLCDRFVKVSNDRGDFNQLAPFVFALALSNYAISVISPLLAVEIAKGAVTYVATLLPLTFIQFESRNGANNPFKVLTKTKINIT